MTASHEPAPPSLSGRKTRLILLTIVLSLLMYAGFAVWSGLDGFFTAVNRLTRVQVATLLSLSCIGYAIRLLRWTLLLRTLGHELPWILNARIYLAGFALTTTPGKVGEALRSHLLKPLGIPYTHSLAALISERASDLAVIVLFSLIGLTSFPEFQIIVIPGIGIVLLIYAMTMNEVLLNRLEGMLRGRGIDLPWLGRLMAVLKSSSRCHNAKGLALSTLLTASAWICEVIALWLLLGWLGAHSDFSIALLSYATATLAGALSFLPGGLGGTEASMSALLVTSGIALPIAVAATIVIRLATLWFAVALGLAAYFWHLSENS